MLRLAVDLLRAGDVVHAGEVVVASLRQTTPKEQPPRKLSGKRTARDAKAGKRTAGAVPPKE